MAERRASRGAAVVQGRYRRVYTAIWRDRDFKALDAAGKTIALYCLTGPQTNRIGLYYLSFGEMFDDLESVVESLATLRRTFPQVVSRFNWRWDSAESVLWIPSWWKYNLPVNPNVLVGCLDDIADVQKSVLCVDFAENRGDLPPSYLKLFDGSIGTLWRSVVEECRRRRGQDQDQDQDRSLLVTVSPGDEPPTVDPAEPFPCEPRGVERGTGLAAKEFADWFVAAYPKHRNGARYMLKDGDAAKVRELLQTWPIERLKQLSEVLLLLDGVDEWIEASDRGIAVLHHRASFLDQRLAAVEAKR